jgi:hypothetical protein
LNSKQAIKYVLAPLLLLFVIITMHKAYWYNYGSKIANLAPKLIETENNKPKSCYDNDCYIINYNGLNTLCFPEENSFKSFDACDKNVECRAHVFYRNNGVFITNDTNVSVLENNFFGYSKVLIKEGKYSGTECYVNPKFVVR